MSENFTIHRIKTCGGRALRQILANLLGFFWALHIVRKEKIDLIHGHMLVGIVFAFLIGKMFRIPVIGTPYSVITTEFPFPINRFANALESFVYPRLSRLIFESEQNRRAAMRHLGCSFQNSTVIHTGLWCPDISCKKVYHGGTLNIFFIGRIVNIKALDRLVAAVAQLETSYREKIRVDIVGEGEELESLRRLVKIGELSDVVRMHGFVADTTPFFLDADVFMLPSHMEGLSVALLEAMSYGLACIINRFGVPFDESVVFQLENNEPLTIARAIRKFIDEPELAREYGRKARAEIEARFSVQAFAENYLKVYREQIVRVVRDQGRVCGAEVEYHLPPNA